MARCTSCGRDIGFRFGKGLCRWCVEHEAARRGELGDNQVQRVMPTPWKRGVVSAGASFNKLFIGVNVLVFIAMVGSGISITDPTTRELIHWGGNYGPLTFGGQPWRLITYMFLHGGILHIAFNMWALWSFGDLAESLYGDWLYALIYLLSGIGGGIASMAWHPGIPSVGASGAIFGVVGALIASLKLGKFSLPGIMVSGTLLNILIFTVYSLVMGAMRGSTDNACHIGGLVTGLVLGALVAVTAPDRDRVFMRIAICIAVLAVLVGSERWAENTRGRGTHVMYGVQLLSQGRNDEAIVELQRAVSREPNNVAARFVLAHAYSNKFQFDRADAEWTRILAIEPDNVEARFNLGMSYIGEKKLAEARQLFTQMGEKDANLAESHEGLAFVAMAEKNYPAAIEEYKRAAQIDPEFDSYYRLGFAYSKLQLHDEAIAAFKRSRETNGDDRNTELALAAEYRAKGMTKEANEATAKAAQLKE